MYRLLLIIGLLIVLYFLLRNAIREYWGSRGQGLMESGKDVMVQDPVCKTYVPKGSAVSAQIGGQTYFFCSQDCAHTFQQQLSS
jgi:YHS domain-containing protein